MNAECAASLAEKIRARAWFGSRAGDHLYGLRPLPAETALKLLVLAAQIEAGAVPPPGAKP